MSITYGSLGTGKLTTLDERVIAALPTGPGKRLRSIAKAAHRAPYVHGGRVPPEFVADVRGVLRGLEHLGKATCRSGWWRAL